MVKEPTKKMMRPDLHLQPIKNMHIPIARIHFHRDPKRTCGRAIAGEEIFHLASTVARSSNLAVVSRENPTSLPGLIILETLGCEFFVFSEVCFLDDLNLSFGLFP